MPKRLLRTRIPTERHIGSYIYRPTEKQIGQEFPIVFSVYYCDDTVAYYFPCWVLKQACSNG
ncbi:hypothetical protein V3C99_016963 [Haemonchus contortus]|uniref:Uncharacterized protein n=1 Tax=Haemonchus contortus TaxID=6289 RepID=A0A7I4YYV7_HAECO